jgi:hypothetical protein
MSPSEWCKPSNQSVPQLTGTSPLKCQDETYDTSEEESDAGWSSDPDAVLSEDSEDSNENDFSKRSITAPNKSTVLPISLALFVKGLPFRRHKSHYSIRDVKTTVTDPQSPPPSGILTVPRPIPLQSRRYSSNHHPIGSPPLTTTHPIRSRTMDASSTKDARKLGKLDFSNNGQNDTPLRDTGWVSRGRPIKYRIFSEDKVSEADSSFGRSPPVF